MKAGLTLGQCHHIGGGLLVSGLIFACALCGKNHRY
jgi:hypothetical protein